MTRRRYAPSGMLALAPQAYGLEYDCHEPAPAAVTADGVAIVDVRGPLMQRLDPFVDSYEAIRARVREALASSPRTLVLRVDSPGGVVAGCFETARELRSMARAAGVPLVAHVDGIACSAGYALACAAERIYVTPTAEVGSVGVIGALVDMTAAQSAAGVAVQLIASGVRKTDGDPRGPITAGAVEAAQERVDALADLFFEWVAEARGMTPDAVRSLEAGIVVGRAALAAGLADGIGSLGEALAMVARAGVPAAAGDGETMTDEEKARAALQAVIDGDGDDKAKARARAALAAMDESEEEPEASSDSDEEKSDDDEAKAGGEEHEARASAAVPAAAAAAVAARGSELERRVAMLEAEREQERKSALFAARSDIPPGMRAELSQLPYAQAKAIVDAMPKPKAPKLAAAAAAATVPVTRGAGHGVATASPKTPELAAMDRVFGNDERAPAIRTEAHAVVFGTMTRDQAAAYVASKGGAR